MRKGIGIILLICGLAVGAFYMVFGRVQIGEIHKVEMVSEEKRIMLDASDRERVSSLLQGRLLYIDQPACGFEDTPYVVFTLENGDTQTFCSAFDDCPIVYYREKDMYCRLSQAENAQFRTMLGEVGT